MSLKIGGFYFYLVTAFLLTVAGLIGTFFLTPLEVKQIGFSQKIFYFHVPMAATSAVAFGVTLLGSIAYLMKDSKNLYRKAIRLTKATAIATVIAFALRITFNVMGIEVLGGIDVRLILLIASISLITLVPVFWFFAFLTRENMDTWASVGAEIGLLFGSMLLVMGILWTRVTWTVWWTWDPRLTSYLLVMLLYSGYFVLRSSVDSAHQRARYSAALGIVSYIAVIFTMISTRVLRSAHPVIFTLSDPGVESSMLITFIVAMFAMIALFGAMIIVKVTINNLREQIEDMKDQLGG